MASDQTTKSAILLFFCPNCHKMLDLDLISNETIIQMRDRPKIVTWSKRMKDAGQKAALTRKRNQSGAVMMPNEIRIDRAQPRSDPFVGRARARRAERPFCKYLFLDLPRRA
jgi:hypothetical protein